MSGDILLASLTDFLTVSEEHLKDLATSEDLIEAKKRFYDALNQYIDFRVSATLEERRRTVSQDRINIAESIDSALKSTASSVRAITALNSAPAPPMHVDDKEAMKKWKEAYQEWYDSKRKRGISVG